MPVHSSYIRYFEMVCRHGSIRKASENLYVASSAVSRQILKLEDELGVSLFKRSPSGVVLTQEGKVFADFVERTVADLNHTLSMLEKFKEDGLKKISIAAQESVVAEFLPRVLLQFNDIYPDVATAFTTVNGKKLINLLNTGEADIAIIFDPQASGDIEEIISQELRVRAVVAANHPLAAKKTLTLDQCSQYPLILPDHSWPLRDKLDQLLQASSIKQNVITSSNSVAFIRAMLKSEQCIGFQTIVGIERQVDEHTFKTIPLKAGDQVITQHYTLCMHKDAQASEPLAALIKLLKARFLEYSQHY